MAAKTTAKRARAQRRPPRLRRPKPISLEERTATLESRLQQTDLEFQRKYRENLDMSWIYHDSALEGVVYTFQELRTAIDPTFAGRRRLEHPARRRGDPPPPRGARLHPRSGGARSRQPITVDLVKKIYLILHPEEGDIKTVKYRKDIPQHRLYFHEYAPPDKITYKVRQIVDWVNDPETKRTRTPVRLAARAHYDLLRVFPFPTDSGKVARLSHEPAPAARGLPAGDHPLDGAAALLRGPQGLERDDDSDRAGGDREQPRVDREAARGVRDARQAPARTTR